MNIGLISTRLNGTDGVSLEVEKWSKSLVKLGHNLFYCAGEVGGYAKNGTCLPLLHFNNPLIKDINNRAFGNQQKDNLENLMEDIHKLAGKIKEKLLKFVKINKIDMLIVENILTIPMNIPLGIGLSNMISETQIITIAHHHDFYWERERFQQNNILKLLDTYFPPDFPCIKHVTINSIASRMLMARREIESIVIPNVFDFEAPPPQIDEFNFDLKEKFNLSPSNLLILQPTRVIRRKGIEMALMLVRGLDIEKPKLILSHNLNDEGEEYWKWLKYEAKLLGVELHSVEDLVASQRETNNGKKIYSLWDIYPHADLVTYPSIYEGFGNGLIEAIYFKKITVVNKYPVYCADIKPLGFEFIELNGYVDEQTIQQTKHILNNPKKKKEMTENNYNLGKKFFSMSVLDKKLEEITTSF